MENIRHINKIIIFKLFKLFKLKINKKNIKMHINSNKK
jgi:hypothetical protein